MLLCHITKLLEWRLIHDLNGHKTPDAKNLSRVSWELCCNKVSYITHQIAECCHPSRVLCTCCIGYNNNKTTKQQPSSFFSSSLRELYNTRLSNCQLVSARLLYLIRNDDDDGDDGRGAGAIRARVWVCGRARRDRPTNTNKHTNVFAFGPFFSFSSFVCFFFPVQYLIHFGWKWSRVPNAWIPANCELTPKYDRYYH